MVSVEITLDSSTPYSPMGEYRKRLTAEALLTNDLKGFLAFCESTWKAYYGASETQVGKD